MFRLTIIDATSVFKQIDGCVMGNTLSSVLTNIFMAKLESDIVRPLTLHSMIGMLTIAFSKKKKDKPDDLLERLNYNHPSFVFTVQENLYHFYNTGFTYGNHFYCKVSKKPGKLALHWKLEILTKRKRNYLAGALHKAKRVSSDLNTKLQTI